MLVISVNAQILSVSQVSGEILDLKQLVLIPRSSFCVYLHVFSFSDDGGDDDCVYLLALFLGLVSAGVFGR